MSAGQLIDVPPLVWVKLVREIWMDKHRVSLAQLLEGGREHFVQSLLGACDEDSPWPREVRRPTPDDLGKVFDLLIQSGAS